MSSKVEIGSDRILRVGGRRFFPIGARHMPTGADPGVLKDTGFNCMRWVAFQMDTLRKSEERLLEHLDGIMFYPYIFDRGDFSRNRMTNERELADLVGRVRDNSGLLCYEQMNEPACILSETQKDPKCPKASPEGMIEASNLIHRLDPAHPIRLGHMTGNLVSTLRRYNDAADIVGCNPYPVVHPEMRPTVRADNKYVDSADQTISCVGEYTSKMMRVGQGKPVWMQLQAHANEYWFKQSSIPYRHHTVYPSRWQMRFMAYHAIVRGATAFEWSMYHLSVDDPAWREVCEVIGELNRLHDVMASPSWFGSLQIEYTELGFSDWSGVETLVKTHGTEAWILAVNSQFDPMEATFSQLPDAVGDSVSVFGENRRLPVVGGRFTDFFEPYEVHVYGPAESGL